MAGKEPQLATGKLGMSQERIEIGMLDKIQMLPVIHAGAPQGTIVDLEAQRMDQMQLKIVYDTQTGDIASILRNFGMNQGDTQHRHQSTTPPPPAAAGSLQEP